MGVTEEQSLPLPCVAELSEPVGYEEIRVVPGETPGCLMLWERKGGQRARAAFACFLTRF